MLMGYALPEPFFKERLNTLIARLFECAAKNVLPLEEARGVCISVCVCACTCACMSVWLYVCVDLCVAICVYVCVCVCMCVCSTLLARTQTAH